MNDITTTILLYLLLPAAVFTAAARAWDYLTCRRARRAVVDAVKARGTGREMVCVEMDSHTCPACGATFATGRLEET